MLQEPHMTKLQQTIKHLESTGEEEWCVGVVRTKGGDQNCILGHVFNMGGEDEKESNRWWRWFEDHIASTFMIYPVNDGEHPDFPQATPRQRCLAYLRAIESGERKAMCEMEFEWGVG